MEKEFKGTRGKWHMVQYAGFMNIQDKPFYGEKDLLDADCVGLEEAEANGYLAAAAPELLQALQNLVAQFKKVSPLYTRDAEIISQAESAINSALNIK